MTLEWHGSDGYSIVLDGSDGVAVGQGVLGIDAPPVDLFTSELTSSDGAVLVKQRKPVRRVVLPLLFVQQTTGGARAEMTALLRSMVVGGILRYTGSQVRDLLNVRYESGAEQGATGRDAGTFVDDIYPISLLALDPWWYGSTDTSVFTISVPIAFDAAIAFDALVSFDAAATNPILVEGDASAFPVTTIVGPFTTLQVGLAGGQSFALAAPLAAGSTIIVDTRPGSRGPSINGGAVDWSLLSPASRLWELEVGTSVMSVSATGETGASSIEMSWRERWLTP